MSDFNMTFDPIPLPQVPAKPPEPPPNPGLLAPPPKPTMPVAPPPLLSAVPLAAEKSALPLEMPGPEFANDKPPLPGRFDWMPEALRVAVTPTRRKGLYIAGVASLIGGAGVASLLVPKKIPPVSIAKLEPAVVVPAAVVEAEPHKMPDLAVPPAAIEQKPIAIPDAPRTTFTPPVLDAAPSPKPAAEAVPNPRLTAGPTISETSSEAPALKSMGGFTPPPPVVDLPPMRPEPLKGPEVTPAGGMELPATPALPQPTPPAGAVLPIPTIADLPKLDAPKTAPLVIPPPAIVDVALPAVAPLVPEVKTTIPTIEKPAELPAPVMPATPVAPGVGAPAAPKLSVEQPAAPKATAPAVEFRPVGTTPTEMPKLMSPPVTVESLPPVATLPPTMTVPAEPPRIVHPAPVSADPNVDYDVDVHYPKAGDSYAAISKQYLHSETYAEALRAFNGGRAISPTQTVDVPPLHILRAKYGAMIGKPAPAAVVPAGNAENRLAAPPARGLREYIVPAGGLTMKEIAEKAWGNEDLWGRVWDKNARFRADQPIPAGTRLLLPTDAKIGE